MRITDHTYRPTSVAAAPPAATYSLIYSFSAKERDTETGLSYFGARYYSSDLSLWLSVDPMSDKYPSMSPYVYCADNPVKLVGPNGEDLVKVTVPGGNNKKQKIIVDSKIADKVLKFANAMYERYGVVVVSSFRSQSKQAQMQKDWDEGRRKGLVCRPASKSAHSSGFALDMNVEDLIKSGKVSKNELADFAKEYGFQYGGALFNDNVHFFIDEKLYYKNRDEASSINDQYYTSHDDIPDYTPDSDSKKSDFIKSFIIQKDIINEADKLRVKPTCTNIYE